MNTTLYVVMVGTMHWKDGAFESSWDIKDNKYYHSVEEAINIIMDACNKYTYMQKELLSEVKCVLSDNHKRCEINYEGKETNNRVIYEVVKIKKGQNETH